MSYAATELGRRTPSTVGALISGVARLPRRAAKHAVRAVSLSLVRALGVDATAEVASRRCLVVAPHPDDETLGCGATIARMRSMGTTVHVVVVSGGGLSPRRAGKLHAPLSEIRRNEARQALSILGVDLSCVRLWDFEDGSLTDHRGDIEEALGDVLRTVAPEQVMVTSASDRHPDHVAVAQATRRTVSRFAPSVPLLEYSIWQRVPALSIVRAGASERPVLVYTRGFLQSKLEAIAAYESQMPYFPLGFVDDFALPFESFRYYPPAVLEG